MKPYRFVTNETDHFIGEVICSGHKEITAGARVETRAVLRGPDLIYQ